MVNISIFLQVTDFGLSFVKGGVGSDSMMQSVCGTPIYMGMHTLLYVINLLSVLVWEVIVTNVHVLDEVQFYY